MKKLLVSFTSLIILMERGSISYEDLDDALFCFNCPREHLFNPKAEELYWGETYEGRLAIQSLIAKATKKAENEGRCGEWREAREIRTTYEKLNSLLEKNGFKPIQTDSRYEPFEVFNRMKGQDIEVIWNS